MKALTLSALVIFGALLLPQSGFTMSKGPVNYVHSVGKSQTQFAISDERDGLLLIRGHAAEVLYKNMQVKPNKENDPTITAGLGPNGWQSTISGSVMNCSELKVGSKMEYACSMKIDDGITPKKFREAYTTTAFNWNEAYGGPNLFKGNSAAEDSGRKIASVSKIGPHGSGDTNVYFLQPKDRHKPTEHVLVLVNGKAAERMYSLMAAAKHGTTFKKGNGSGYRGDGIACVHSENVKKADTNRCSFTVSLSSGDIVKDYNPLFLSN